MGDRLIRRINIGKIVGVQQRVEFLFKYSIRKLIFEQLLANCSERFSSTVNSNIWALVPTRD